MQTVPNAPRISLEEEKGRYRSKACYICDCKVFSGFLKITSTSSFCVPALPLSVPEGQNMAGFHMRVLLMEVWKSEQFPSSFGKLTLFTLMQLNAMPQ